MREKNLQIQDEFGVLTDVYETLEDDSPNPEWSDLWKEVENSTVVSHVDVMSNTRIILDDNAKILYDKDQERIALDEKLITDKTVVITVDDKTMPITVEEKLLQVVADNATKTIVAIRVAKEKGVNVADVDVKTYDEYYGG